MFTECAVDSSLVEAMNSAFPLSENEQARFVAPGICCSLTVGNQDSDECIPEEKLDPDVKGVIAVTLAPFEAKTVTVFRLLRTTFSRSFRYVYLLTSWGHFERILTTTEIVWPYLPWSDCNIANFGQATSQLFLEAREETLTSLPLQGKSTPEVPLNLSLRTPALARWSRRERIHTMSSLAETLLSDVAFTLTNEAKEAINISCIDIAFIRHQQSCSSGLIEQGMTWTKKFIAKTLVALFFTAADVMNPQSDARDLICSSSLAKNRTWRGWLAEWALLLGLEFQKLSLDISEGRRCEAFQLFCISCRNRVAGCCLPWEAMATNESGGTGKLAFDVAFIYCCQS